MLMKICMHCKKTLDIKDRLGRGDSCPFCFSDLKVCLNCRFYDRNSHNECRESSAEMVTVKDRANFCEFFEFKDTETPAAAEDRLERLKGLFK